MKLKSSVVTPRKGGTLCEAVLGAQGYPKRPCFRWSHSVPSSPPLGAAGPLPLPSLPHVSPSHSTPPLEEDIVDISQRRLRADQTLAQGHSLIIRALRGADPGPVTLDKFITCLCLGVLIFKMGC